MNTFMNTFIIFQFLLIFFHPVLTRFQFKYEILLSIILCTGKTNGTYLINTFNQ